MTLIALIGCGKESGPEKVSVSGTVSFDGTPVEDGEIIFEPTDGRTPFAGKITAGKFSTMVLPGEHKVRITATRDDPSKTIPGIEPGTTVKAKKQYIPVNYNKTTELIRNVGDDGAEFTFDLKPK